MTENEHLLICLAEECSEVIQAVSKALRFGEGGSYPDGMKNVDKIAFEMLDVLAVREMLEDRGILSPFSDKQACSVMDDKKERVLFYMRTLAVQNGALPEPATSTGEGL